MTLIRGILLILLGVYALINPLMAAAALAQVVGFYLILDGAIAIYAGVAGQTPSRLWTTVRGVILILVGLFVVGHPIIMAMIHATLLVCLLAGSAIMSGILEIYVAIRDRRETRTHVAEDSTVSCKSKTRIENQIIDSHVGHKKVKTLETAHFSCKKV